MESSAIHYEDAPLFRAGRLHSIIYWLGNIYIITSIRSCPFSQGLPRLSESDPPAIARHERAGGGQAFQKEP